MNRGWDIRLFENLSARTVFLMLMIDVFVLGMICSMLLYDGVRLHRFELTNAILFVVFFLSVFRYSGAVYRRLDSDR